MEITRNDLEHYSKLLTDVSTIIGYPVFSYAVNRNIDKVEAQITRARKFYQSSWSDMMKGKDPEKFKPQEAQEILQKEFDKLQDKLVLKYSFKDIAKKKDQHLKDEKPDVHPDNFEAYQKEFEEKAEKVQNKHFKDKKEEFDFLDAHMKAFSEYLQKKIKIDFYKIVDPSTLPNTFDAKTQKVFSFMIA